MRNDLLKQTLSVFLIYVYTFKEFLNNYIKSNLILKLKHFCLYPKVTAILYTLFKVNNIGGAEESMIQDIFYLQLWLLEEKAKVDTNGRGSFEWEDIYVLGRPFDKVDPPKEKTVTIQCIYVGLCPIILKKFNSKGIYVI